MLDLILTPCEGYTTFCSEPAPREFSRKTARAWGFVKYFTGKLCKNGHLRLRRVSDGICGHCGRDKARRRRLKDPEKVRDNYRKWVSQNPERARANWSRWREENPEKVLKSAHEWRLRNPEKVRQTLALHYQENKFYYKELATLRKKRIRRATPIWADLIKIRSVYKKSEEATEVTGIPYEVDHIIPLRGKYVCGLHVENNLQILPASVNRLKSNHFELEDQPEGV